MIYLDNAATTKVCPGAADAVLNAMKTDFGNPSSLYRLGLDAENIITEAADSVARAISALPKEIIFTSGATESNNLALLGAARAKGRFGKRIITSTVEHPSVYETAKALEARGFEVVFISPKDGALRAQDFIDAANDDTILVSCMLVNNETGAVSPVGEIAAGVRRKSPNALIHTDAVQAFCKIPISVKRLGVDLMSISGHKIYGPKGVGALYIKSGAKLKPLLLGGGQQNGMRVGTEPVPQIAGLSAAVKYCLENFESNFEHYRRLRDYFYKLCENEPDIIPHPSSDSAPYILNFSVLPLKSEVLLHFLEQKEIYVSSGSACSKGKKSRVLKEFGVSDQESDSALRISFSPQTELCDLDALVSEIKRGLNTLRHTRSQPRGGRKTF